MPHAVYAKIDEEQFQALVRGEAVEIESVAGPKVVVILADIGWASMMRAIEVAMKGARGGGTDIRGGSMRLAEDIAERWGKIGTDRDKFRFDEV
jgi:hypothetical protein